MANADTTTKTVVTGVTLDLSLKEATALAAVLCRVGGNPDTTGRGLIDGINKALQDNAITQGQYESDENGNESNLISGSIYFSK